MGVEERGESTQPPILGEPSDPRVARAINAHLRRQADVVCNVHGSMHTLWNYGAFPAFAALRRAASAREHNVRKDARCDDRRWPSTMSPHQVIVDSLILYAVGAVSMIAHQTSD
jgi:hypothetical protein